MIHERGFVVDAQVSDFDEPYPAWIRSLIYIASALFGIGFWSALFIAIFH
jgi:hypothetical protein